jgi:hypothetical protein
VKNKAIAGLCLYYDVEQQDAAELIGRACERSAQLCHQHWGLAIPADCRVYVMTSWRRFLFHSAPWPGKVYLALTLPFVARRASQIWPYAGGWALQYGSRRVVGVKPPHLIEASDRSLGEQIFVQDRDLSEIVGSVTCHELVHAFTFHLKLPAWLHEGLATLAMEYYLDRRIVREETLENLAHLGLKHKGLRTVRLCVDDTQLMLAQYARGYWLTRHIDEAQPEVMRDLLVARMGHEELNDRVAKAFGKERKSFWEDIDRELLCWRKLKIIE